MTRTSLMPVGLVLALAGCGTPTVPLSIGFPSQEAFNITSTLDVQMVPLDADLGACPTLLGNAVRGTDVHASTSVLGITPCSVRAGATLPDPGSGAHAFIVLGRATNGVILAGCTVGEAYPGGPAISVDLYPTSTDAYSTALAAAHLPPGTTADQHCAAVSP
jgi:hypothetical protein